MSTVSLDSVAIVKSYRLDLSELDMYRLPILLLAQGGQFSTLLLPDAICYIHLLFSAILGDALNRVKTHSKNNRARPPFTEALTEQCMVGFACMRHWYISVRCGQCFRT